MSEHRTSPNFHIDVAEARYGELELDVPAMTSNSIAIHLFGQCQVDWLPDSRLRSGRPALGAMTLIPAGQSGRLRVTGGPSEVLKLSISDDALAHYLRDQDKPVGHALFMERFGVSDPLVRHLGLALQREIRQQATSDTLYRDALSNALVAHLLAHHARNAVRPEPRRVRSLSRRSAQCIESYLRASLQQAIGLGDMADEVGLSTSHFSAQFRETYGVTPNQYLTRLRLEKAREMLVRTDRTVTDISASVGFSTPSHFAFAFRIHFGETPTSCRRR